MRLAPSGSSPSATCSPRHLNSVSVPLGAERRSPQVPLSRKQLRPRVPTFEAATVWTEEGAERAASVKGGSGGRGRRSARHTRAGPKGLASEKRGRSRGLVGAAELSPSGPGQGFRPQWPRFWARAQSWFRAGLCVFTPHNPLWRKRPRGLDQA